MAHIFPFSALLPQKGKELEISANIHVDDIQRQKEIVKNNPYTYLNVVRPYLKLGEEKNPEIHFPLAKKNLEALISEGILNSAGSDSVFIYRQIHLQSQRSFLGLVCTVSVEDYDQGRIRKHENTLTEKEHQLIQHIEQTGVIGEPVLLTHRKDAYINSLLEDCLSKGELIMDFEDDKGYRHRVCQVTEKEIIEEFKKAYDQMGDLYIADGHHRSAASAGYFIRHQISDGKYLAFIVPPEYLKIESFHRAYKCDKLFDSSSFVARMSEVFELRKCESPYKSLKEKEFGMYVGGEWYKVAFSKQYDELSLVDKLDVSILERMVFRDLLDIQDSKTDKRLDFLRGGIAAEELQKMVDEGRYDLVFTVFPCTIQEVFDIADVQGIMPPKSTYIEPKMRTGLFIQKV